MTKKMLLLSVFAVLSTATVNAQETIRLKVSVPFSFYIGHSVMPAGEADAPIPICPGVLFSTVPIF